MKKAALPLYAILVTGCLTCFQTDDNLNVLNLTACVSGKHIGRVDGKTIIVAPGTPKISDCYKLVNPAYSLTITSCYNCCKLAVEDLQ